MPRVSVILAARNAESMVADCLSSVLASDFSDFEIILVDDASSDKTLQVAELVASRDSRVRVYRNSSRMWLAASLNKAIRKSSGEFIARIDADDMMTPDRISTQIDVLQRNPSIGVVGSAVAKIDESGGFLGLSPPKCPSAIIHWTSIWRVPFFHPTVMMRRSILCKNNLLYDDSLQRSQDFEFWRRLLVHTSGFNIYRPLILYRCHPQQTTQIQIHESKKLHATLCIQHVREVLGAEITEEIATQQYRVFGPDARAATTEQAIEHIELREALSAARGDHEISASQRQLGFGYDLLRYCLVRRGDVNWRWLGKSKYRITSMARAATIMKDEILFRFQGRRSSQIYSALSR
ncbi:MAG: glycosyltransferase family 2 protein [Natronohydrobacter sp.]|nr:glycosyltransferase family 2 protein [Natronohydrobacter sp.]